MKHYDLRKGDTVHLNIKDAESRNEAITFCGKIAKNKTLGQYLAETFLENKSKTIPFIIQNILRTPKSKTEYCIIRRASSQTPHLGVHALNFYIQARFLKVVVRKRHHPVTSIFMEDKYYTPPAKKKEKFLDILKKSAKLKP
jgi:hypothetical protein